MDCDMIFRRNIAELWALRYARYAVMCCMYSYQLEETSEFLGNFQAKYEEKLIQPHAVH